MKKYFMQGTADEVKFGDQIVLDLTKSLPNGKVQHHHINCKFIPELVPLLLDGKIIEVQEVKEKKEKPLDFQDNCPMIDELISANQNLEHRVYDLEKAVNKLNSILMNVKPHKNARKSA